MTEHRTSFNATESGSLQGLTLLAQVLYLRGLREFMDYSTRLVGTAARRICIAGLIETAEFLPDKGSTRKKKRPGKEAVLSAIRELTRAGLIERRILDDNPRQYVFFLPLAHAHKSAQIMNPTKTPTRTPQRNGAAPLFRADEPDKIVPMNPTTSGRDKTTIPKGMGAKAPASHWSRWLSLDGVISETMTEAKARTFLGGQIRRHGEARVIEAIGIACQRNIADPISWLPAMLREMHAAAAAPWSKLPDNDHQLARWAKSHQYRNPGRDETAFDYRKALQVAVKARRAELQPQPKEPTAA